MSISCFLLRIREPYDSIIFKSSIVQIHLIHFKIANQKSKNNLTISVNYFRHVTVNIF